MLGSALASPPVLVCLVLTAALQVRSSAPESVAVFPAPAAPHRLEVLWRFNLPLLEPS